ncbi:uncharacterized protein [Tiliqua scincoides]|uniref:uncharacterized protein isoform X2 n=1 Tax=Tiliqua scincoides TaxID=71010 RepID=UPI003461B146
MSEDDDGNSQESDVLFLGALQESIAKPDPPMQPGDNSNCKKKPFIFQKGESSPALFKRGNAEPVQNHAGVNGPRGKSPLSPKPSTSKPPALDSHKKGNTGPVQNILQRKAAGGPSTFNAASNQKGNTGPVQNILQRKAAGGPSTSNVATTANQKDNHLYKFIH